MSKRKKRVKKKLKLKGKKKKKNVQHMKNKLIVIIYREFLQMTNTSIEMWIKEIKRES